MKGVTRTDFSINQKSEQNVHREKERGLHSILQDTVIQRARS